MLPEIAFPDEGGQRVAWQRVGKPLLAFLDGECLRVVVLVVRDQHGRAIRVPERDVHNLAVPSSGAERGAGDAHGARLDEPGQLPERVVLGVGSDRISRADGNDAGAGAASPDMRPAGGSSARFQLITVLDQLRVEPISRFLECHLSVSEKVFAGSRTGCPSTRP